MSPTPVIAVVGWHNAGKTTFIERLLGVLKGRGLRVAVIKHSREDITLDRPGTDTWRYAQAGSDLVAISGKGSLALIERRARELSLDDILARLPADIDLVITEGFKGAHVAKIEVLRPATGIEPIATPDELLALVSDEPTPRDTLASRFASADIAGVVALLAARGFIP